MKIVINYVKNLFMVTNKQKNTEVFVLFKGIKIFK